MKNGSKTAKVDDFISIFMLNGGFFLCLCVGPPCTLRSNIGVGRRDLVIFLKIIKSFSFLLVLFGSILYDSFEIFKILPNALYKNNNLLVQCHQDDTHFLALYIYHRFGMAHSDNEK